MSGKTGPFDILGSLAAAVTMPQQMSRGQRLSGGSSGSARYPAPVCE